MSVKILLGGSPCTAWSVAQKKNRETKPEGIGWELFKNYLIAKEKFRPDFFLYENNESASNAIKEQISKELGYPLKHINSALVSAQTRKRIYCTNWNAPQPEDRGILLKDILELSASVVEKEKAYCLCTDHIGTTRDYFKKHQSQVVFEPIGVASRGRKELIKQLNPKIQIWENPVGALRTMSFMQDLKRNTTSYCKWGFTYRKATDFFSNIDLKLPPPCKNGDTCHEKAPRGSRSGLQAIKDPALKAIYPPKLCEHIVDICEEYLKEKSNEISCY